MKFPFV